MKWIIPVSTSSPHLPCLAVLQVSRECPTEPHTWAAAWLGPWGQCGARATQQLCLMSSKRLQTWTLIPSAVRRPVSNAVRQDCAGRLSSDGTQWEQTGGFSRKHCNSQENGLSLKTSEREESIGSRFCFFYETRTRGITQHLDVSMPALKTWWLPVDHTWPWYFWFSTPKSALDLTSVMISSCRDGLKQREDWCLPAARHICYLWQKEGFKRRTHITRKLVHSNKRLPARAKQANNGSETDPKTSRLFAVDYLWQGAIVVALLISARPKSAFLKGHTVALMRPRA